MRTAAKVDANQAEIVDALRQAGASVTLLHRVGGGVPDLLVGYQRVTSLIEVKDGSKPPSRRKLTQDQIDWHASWRGSPVFVVETVEQAISALKEMKSPGARSGSGAGA